MSADQPESRPHVQRVAHKASLMVLANSKPQAHARAKTLLVVARHWRVSLHLQALSTEAFDGLADDAPPPHVLWVNSDVPPQRVAATLLRWRCIQPVAVLLDGELPAGEAWACLLSEHDVLVSSRAALQRWLQARSGDAADNLATPLPALWQGVKHSAWQGAVAPSVCLQGTRQTDQGLQWLDSTHAQGWLKPDVQRSGAPAPRDEAQVLDDSTPLQADDAQLAATALAMAKGFVAADAITLGLSVDAQGQGCPLPRLSWGVVPSFVEPVCRDGGLSWPEGPSLYAIVDTAKRLKQCAEHGAQVVQLRSKLPPEPRPLDRDRLRADITDSVAAAHKAGACLFINDHRQVALEQGAGGLHLGQEDLLALTELQRTALRQPRVQAAGGRLMTADWAAPGMHKANMQRLLLGISSHSVWELARARSLAPDYVACGPVWATTTKDMPWIPQSLHNLRWWVAQAGCPVVAIGGILEAEHIVQTAATGAAAVCVVRGLGEDPSQTLPKMQQALQAGHAAARPDVPPLPLPSLLSGVGVPDRLAP